MMKRWLGILAIALPSTAEAGPIHARDRSPVVEVVGGVGVDGPFLDSRTARDKPEPVLPFIARRVAPGVDSRRRDESGPPGGIDPPRAPEAGTLVPHRPPPGHRPDPSAPTPEPSGIVLVITGLAGLVLARNRRRAGVPTRSGR